MHGRSVSGQFRTVNEWIGKVVAIRPGISLPGHRRVISLALAVTAVLIGAGVAAPAHAAGDGVLHLVQGLPGRTVDLAVDGKVVAADVKAADVVGPVRVAAGQHRITAREGSKVLLERRITVGAGSNLDVVVHRPASPTAAPVITSYANKLAAVPKDKAALRVAHTAAVGPADIRVNGKVLFANVANGESLDVVVPAGTYSVEIVPAGATSPVVLGPVSLPARAGYLTRVFAVGEPNSKTMNVAVGTLRLPRTGSDKPSLVDTGAGGQAAGLVPAEQLGAVPNGSGQGDGSPVAPLAVAALLAAALLLGTAKAVRR